MARTASQVKPNPNVHARVPEEVKQRWQTAAAICGQTLTNFLIVAVNKATDDVFDKEEKIKLTKRDQIKLANMLLNPPEINNAMANILTRYNPHSKKPLT
jgi:uncharacterized protein (DUF1778 family)